MSKFDNLFKTVTGNSNVNSGYSRVNDRNNANNNNAFKDKGIEDTNKKITYNYHNAEFPDLVENVSSVFETNSSKNYANIAANVNEIVVIKKNDVLPGWTQYSKSKQSHLFEVTYGSKTKRQIEQELADAKLSNPLYIYRQMITTLECRWARYKIRYDKIHGEGSYDLEYHTDLIYDFDENFSDVEKDYDYEKDYNSSNSQDDYKKLKKYSVNNKQ
jgi:hypothetical protein